MCEGLADAPPDFFAVKRHSSASIPAQDFEISGVGVIFLCGNNGDNSGEVIAVKAPVRCVVEAAQNFVVDIELFHVRLSFRYVIHTVGGLAHILKDEMPICFYWSKSNGKHPTLKAQR
jgi:hypothetical protein